MPESTLEGPRRGRTLTVEALTQRGASLADLDWRLLHWLLRYPLQRADDVMVGVARWAGRATVYRHLRALVEHGLVESVVPKMPGEGKWLYYLSNLGLHVLAYSLERPARELALSYQADEAGLLRRLPRLPTLLLLQDAVNGLVTGAAEAMTMQGRRPRLIRWTWQRDLTHRFQCREKAMRLFADGAVALCIRTQQGGGGTPDRWYGLFILYTELDDERLMRLRLERLLCWRESPERWSSYQHMLPVLILAGSTRQRDHWQRAVEDSALKLRLDPLQGALACLPLPESTRVNPWMFNWRTLSTEVSSHLQELLRPMPPASFLRSLGVEGEGEEPDAQSSPNASVVTASTGKPARLVVGNLASRAARVTGDDQKERESIALLRLRLTPCYWNMLRLLLVHPLLSDEELAAFLNLQRQSARCSLYDLHQLGCLEPIPTEVGKRWHLCERGLRLVAAANHIYIRNIAVISDDAADGETPTVSQRGEAWLLKHMQHTAGIYDFFAKLIQAARQELGHALCWWETGAACERRYRMGEQWHNLRPDALAAYRVGPRQICFWLEWDRGTMNVRDLAIKFTAYAHYIASREWARERSTLPRLFCIVPDIAQESRMQRVAQASLAHTSGLVLRATTEVLLKEYGPLAPIWLQTIPWSSQLAEPGALPRSGLFNVIPETM
jgi:Replication-relaxation